MYTVPILTKVCSGVVLAVLRILTQYLLNRSETMRVTNVKIQQTVVLLLGTVYGISEHPGFNHKFGVGDATNEPVEQHIQVVHDI